MKLVNDKPELAKDFRFIPEPEVVFSQDSPSLLMCVLELGCSEDIVMAVLTRIPKQRKNDRFWYSGNFPLSAAVGVRSPTFSNTPESDEPRRSFSTTYINNLVASHRDALWNRKDRTEYTPLQYAMFNQPYCDDLFDALFDPKLPSSLSTELVFSECQSFPT